MTNYVLTNHQAQMAVWLAYRLRGAPSDQITSVLSGAGCPRALFVLASVLQAASRSGAVVETTI